MTAFKYTSAKTFLFLRFFAALLLLLLVQTVSHSSFLALSQDLSLSQDSSRRASFAPSVIEFGIPGKPPSRNVTIQTEYCIDTAQSITIERILYTADNKITSLFHSADSPIMNLGYLNGVLWLKFSLQRLPLPKDFQHLIDSTSNNLSVQMRLGESFQPWVLALNNRIADSVSLYITHGNTILYADTTGFGVTYSRWRVPSTQIAFPLPITAGEPVVCYVRMYMNGLSLYAVTLQPQNQYNIKEFDFKLPLVLFYGIALFAIVFSLLSWILTRSRYYALYTLYVICLVSSIGLDSGLLYQVFRMDTPFLHNRLYILSWLSSMVLGVLFVWVFVREQRIIKIPWVWRWSAGVFFSCCAVALVAEFVDARGFVLEILYYGYLILAVPTTLAMSFIAWRGGYRPALYVFASRVIVELGIGVNSLAALGIISYSSIWVSQLSLLVPAVEMMLMGLALADRITVLQRAKQEAERKALQGELYRLQNEELSAANKEITRQQSEIMQQAAEIQEMNAQVTELNISLQQQNHDLVEANREKNEIMGIVAHDLKNPIGGVRGMAELIESVFADDRTQTTNAARQIMQTSDRMLELVKKLLDINKLESGEFAMDCYAFDIEPIVSMIIEQYTAPAEAKNITFHTELPTTSRSIIFANEQAVMQALENIISNAVKYSPHGKNVYVRVTNRVGSDSDEADGREASNSLSLVRVEVEDEGPGFTEEDKTKLFGKFARLSAQPTGGEHSTGLGLSIVKRMVEAMRGRVWCESEVGKGATFIVELPRSQESLL